MSAALRILVVDDDKSLASAIAESLTTKGHACTIATSGRAGAVKVEAGDFDLVFTDLKMPDLDGMEIVKLCREKMPEAEVYLVTGVNDVKSAVQAMKLGASHYLLKPPDMTELRMIAEKAAERLALT